MEKNLFCFEIDSFLQKNNCFIIQIINKIIFICLFFLYLLLSQNNNNSRFILLKKARKYMNICINDILINKNTNNYTNELNITVIIPIYNCENTIKKSIRSIQNQIMNNIEILLINDFSKDNSLKIIEDLAKEDYRIIIINNNKNMGTLYSRCIGVLKAKGKYILALDNDDLFMNENVFDTVFQEAEKGNYDI